MFHAVGRERGAFRLGSEEVPLAIRTSRIFRKINGQWRQVHHHESIDDPELLRRCQMAVSGKPAWQQPTAPGGRHRQAPLIDNSRGVEHIGSAMEIPIP